MCSTIMFVVFYSLVVLWCCSIVALHDVVIHFFSSFWIIVFSLRLSLVSVFFSSTSNHCLRQNEKESEWEERKKSIWMQYLLHWAATSALIFLVVWWRVCTCVCLNFLWALDFQFIQHRHMQALDWHCICVWSAHVLTMRVETTVLQAN